MGFLFLIFNRLGQRLRTGVAYKHQNKWNQTQLRRTVILYQQKGWEGATNVATPGHDRRGSQPALECSVQAIDTVREDEM